MLVALLKYGLFHGEEPSLPLAADQWEVLVADAKRHAVTALLYDAVSRLSLAHGEAVPREVLFRLLSSVETIENDNRRREAALQHFAQTVHTALGIDTIVVKGSSLARCYPLPLHRECGDNDVYFPRELGLQVDALLRQQGIDIDTKDPRHSSFLFDGVPFESHRYLLYPTLEGDDSGEPQWRTCPLSNHLLQLTPSHAALFTAAHLEHHAVFFNEPLPLGKLIDWALLLQAGFDYDEFNKVKVGYDVDRFADLLTQYCVAGFGIAPPRGFRPLSDHALRDFDAIYLRPQPRHRWALVRVMRRSTKYIRYRRIYREIYGSSPFSRFYWRNLLQALHQLFTSKPRAQGREV
jgi:hypothetical protein